MQRNWAVIGSVRVCGPLRGPSLCSGPPELRVECVSQTGITPSPVAWNPHSPRQRCPGTKRPPPPTEKTKTSGTPLSVCSAFLSRRPPQLQCNPSASLSVELFPCETLLETPPNDFNQMNPCFKPLLFFFLILIEMLVVLKLYTKGFWKCVYTLYGYKPMFIV